MAKFISNNNEQSIALRQSEICYLICGEYRVAVYFQGLGKILCVDQGEKVSEVIIDEGNDV